ncbi:MAG TPA: MoxR family ATPase [Propionicimonas sp.]|nr:MoxR family ATPase [Propionicimonas sp.]HQA77795.1 MoxR family ATPase [Propionicimonas sp.]HQD96678.1 MoxR family ATPase [Propionicimonas sp.]
MTSTDTEIGEVLALAQAVRATVSQVIEGKPEAVDLAITALLAESHLLIEDVPGVGKTMLAKSLARAIDCTVRRIQFTPDLLPSDITGVSVWAAGEFQFKPGGIFANIVIGDEINRASPKTQSALLEAMEERRVSVDTTTHLLPRPFLVIATQNPIEMEGTYPLPEAQRDRFGLRISMGYPSTEAEVAMLDHHGERDMLEPLVPVTDAAAVMRAVQVVRRVFVHSSLKSYLVGIVNETRSQSATRLGASPRAGLQLMRAAKARAAMSGRNYVIPEDISDLAEPTLAHRILLNAQAQRGPNSSSELIHACVRAVPVPTGRR